MQGLVEHLGKGSLVGGLLGELHEPLVAAMAFSIHEDWGCRIFQHLSSRGSTGSREPLLGIVHHQFLTEGVDEALGAA